MCSAGRVAVGAMNCGRKAEKNSVSFRLSRLMTIPSRSTCRAVRRDSCGSACSDERSRQVTYAIDVQTPVVATPSVEIDLTPGRPDLTTFPRAAWIRAQRTALQTAPPTDLGYSDPRGLLRLREQLSGWLATVRGVRAAPDQIIVTDGFAQALALLSDVLPRRGITSVAVEEPGSRGARDSLTYWQMRTTPVPVDQDGIVVDALAQTSERVAIVTPAHQFPTGVVLSAERRHALVAWARRHDGYVVEDDYDAEHRFDRPPVPAMHTLAPDRVIYSGSVSKTLAPGVRLGWLVAPDDLVEPLARSKYHSDLGSSSPPQLTLAELLSNGAYDRHIRSVTSRHRERRNAVVDAVHRHLPDATISGAAAGLHVVVALPDGTDDELIARRALAAGARVHPLSWHRQTAGRPGLIIGYATHAPERLREGIARISYLL